MVTSKGIPKILRFLFLVPFRGLNSIRFESTFQASVGCRPRAACLLKHACGGGGVVALREGKARILAHEHRGLEIKIEFKFPFSNVVFPSTSFVLSWFDLFLDFSRENERILNYLFPVFFFDILVTLHALRKWIYIFFCSTLMFSSCWFWRRRRRRNKYFPVRIQ